MDFRLAPKPIVEIRQPADKGIVSRKEYFVKKTTENVSEIPYPVHLMRDWRPKASLIYSSVEEESQIRYECNINRNIQNPFVEDDAEEVFLSTPPPCFVLLGKRGSKIQKIADDITQHYGSISISTQKVLDEMMKQNNEISRFLDRVLRTGVALTLNFILALMSLKAHTQSTRHRGYVISGLPTLPYSFDKSAEQQLNYIYTWDLKPTVFVHVLSEDEDLLNDRLKFRYKFCGNGRLMTLEYVMEKNSMDVNMDISRCSFWMTPHTEEHIWAELERYFSLAQPIVDIFRARIDPQYFVVVDARCRNPFEMVEAKFGLLPLTIPPRVKPFVSLKEKLLKDEEEEEVEEEEEIDDIKQIIGQPPDQAFLFLFNKNNISPKYRWELSHYNYVCPVALRDRKIIEGQSEFSVMFMKYIYFLSSKESMLKFIENPRPYVLPVRPHPLFRLIVIENPFIGKTTLARRLAEEFGIPYLNFAKIKERDKHLKKNAYREYYRRRVQQRVITRLTTEAWAKWRVEEEDRFACIEEWMNCVQSVLTDRIAQFCTADFSVGSSDKYNDEKSVRSYLLGCGSSKENKNATYKISEELSQEVSHISSNHSSKSVLEVHGTTLGVSSSSLFDGEYTPSDTQTTPSARIVHAMRHQNYEFNPESFEIEAELFFSALWSTCVKEADEMDRNEEIEEREILAKSPNQSVDSISSDNWARNLPPQSLSSLLIWRKTVNIRERRKSFSTLLAAASKHSWKSSPLKSEFLKWRLPCFMDIPLCEKYVDNPVLLLKYCPEELKVRPPFPEPIDYSHPEVIEAGHKAYKEAGVVEITYDGEEEGIILNHAIEKVERNRIRLSGDIISPGGWVLDNMPLDPAVWNSLVKSHNLPDRIYVLVDSGVDCRRILDTWMEMGHTRKSFTAEYSSIGDIDFPIPSSSSSSNKSDKNLMKDNASSTSGMPSNNVLNLLRSELENLVEGDKELDEIYNLIQESEEGKIYYYSTLLEKSTAGSSAFHLSIQTERENTSEDGVSEGELESNWILNFRPRLFLSDELILGPQFINFSKILSILNDSSDSLLRIPNFLQLNKSCVSVVNFFVEFLHFRTQLNNLMHWFQTSDLEGSVEEIDVLNKTENDIVMDIKSSLLSKFGKKPRKLEDFEVEELKAQFSLDVSDKGEEVEGEEMEEKTSSDERNEDIRIYGESGPFCVVALERGILLKGKLEFVLRYYGKLYFFSREKAMEAFIKEPEKYAPYYSVIRCLPPLRIYVVGPFGCGKSSIASSASDHLSTHMIDYIQLLNTKLLPNMGRRCTKMKSLNQKTYLSDSHNEEAATLLNKFMNLPYTVRCQWLDEPPFYPNSEEEQQPILKVLEMLDKPKGKIEMTQFPVEFVPVVEEGVHGNTGSTMEPLPYYTEAETEEMLNHYISSGISLPAYYTEKTIKRVWTEEPYLSEGFVVDDYPLRFVDAEILKENNWFPDVIIEVTLPPEEVVARVIDLWMKDWERVLEREMLEEQRLENTLLAVQNVLSARRRNDLTKEIQNSLANQAEEGEKSGESPSNSNESVTASVFDSYKVSSESSSKQVEETIELEFPQMIFNVNWETYDSARARIEAEMYSCYAKDREHVDKLKVELQDSFSQWIEIESNKPLNKILSDLFIELDPIKKRKHQRCEFAFSLDVKTADNLIEQGFYFLSRFGRWCPVQIYDFKNPFHMFRPFMLKEKITPIAYRNYIYFVAGEYAKNRFLSDPVKFIFSKFSNPIIPLRVAVIGPPKCGKTTLANRLASTLDLKIITMGSALRFVMTEMATSRLARSVDHYLRRGCFLPLRLKVETIVSALQDSRCVTQGFILDGLPFSPALTQSLAEEGILPFVIISLVGDAKFSKKNSCSLNVLDFRLKYKRRIHFDKKYDEWTLSYDKFVVWNRDTYHNIYEIDAKMNPSDIFYQTLDIISRSFFQIQRYVQLCHTDEALQLEYLCISRDEFDCRKSQYLNYCPVCWATSSKLTVSQDPPSRSGLVQFREFIYWVCPKDMKDFLKTPKKFFTPHTPLFPKLLPKIIDSALCSESQNTLHVYGNGRCVVTRSDFPDRLELEGSWEYAASYSGAIYLMRNAEMLKRFMSTPWKYYSVSTVFEVGPIKKSVLETLGPPKVTTLPPIGFLEQTVADRLQKALLTVGKLRPLYPNLSPHCTASVFIALYLKVGDESNKYSHVEKKYLDFMLQNCDPLKYDKKMIDKPKRPETGQGDYEEELEDSYEDEESEKESDSMQMTSSVEVDTNRFDKQPDESMWVAKKIDPARTEMLMTAENNLIEIPEVPKYKVLLRYQTYTLRCSPIPPVTCLNYVYTVREKIKLPDKFNYNTLYQPLPFFSSDINFNSETEFDTKLFSETVPSDFSDVESSISSRIQTNEATLFPNLDPELAYMLERFIPRFQILDVLPPVAVPEVPIVVQKEPLIFNPHRDYTYILLYSEFFPTSYLLQGFNSSHDLEFVSRIQGSILKQADSDFIFSPTITRSMLSMRSISQYHIIFDEASKFYVREKYEEPTNKMMVLDIINHILDDVTKDSSVTTFTEIKLFEILNEDFGEDMEITDTFVNWTTSVPDTGNTEIIVEEMSLFPPLIPHIESHPYHSYLLIPSIFIFPVMDDFFHERYVATLDGIQSPPESLNFVSYSFHSSSKNQMTKSENSSSTYCPFYEHFSIPWTAFLAYPFSWAYNLDLKANFDDISPTVQDV